jgi:integrase
MANIFRRKTRAGKPAKNWSIQYQDERGKWRIVKGCSTKELTRQKALGIEQRVLNIKAGLVDPFEAPKASPLLEHVQAFKREMEGKGRDKYHIDPTINRVTTIFEACRFKTIDDLTRFDVADEVNRYLATRDDLATGTINHYLTALKSFTRWAVKQNRMPASSLLMIGSVATEGEESFQRRALTVEQFDALIAAADMGKKVQRQSGEDRAWLYMTAAYSGLRASELASLTPTSFLLQGDSPVIVARRGYTKNKEEARQPIRPDFAAMLAPWLQTKAGTIWPGRWYRRAAEMLRVDLEAAGIEPETEEGVCDFHALRVTYITNLARAGVHPSIAQRLARHSSITLTMGTYTKLSKAEVAEGLRGLPAPAKRAIRAQ